MTGFLIFRIDHLLLWSQCCQIGHAMYMPPVNDYHSLNPKSSVQPQSKRAISIISRSWIWEVCFSMKNFQSSQNIIILYHKTWLTLAKTIITLYMTFQSILDWLHYEKTGKPLFLVHRVLLRRRLLGWDAMSLVESNCHFSVKMWAAGFCEILVLFYQTTWCQIPKDSNLHSHGWESPKTHSSYNGLTKKKE